MKGVCELAFLQRGPDLVCIATPVDGDYNGPLALEITRIKIKLLRDKADMDRWIDLVKSLWLPALAQFYGEDAMDAKWVDVTPKETRQ